ncbi:MAG: O-antigen ligase family protein [Candidatus Omnitrophota bacterium]
MIRLILAMLVIVLCCFWLVWRRFDKNIPNAVRLIIISTCGLFFLRTIIGETYLFSAQLIFQVLIFFLGFVYLLYLCIGKQQLANQPVCFSLNLFDKLFFLFISFLTISVWFSVNKEASIATLVYFSSLYVWYWLIANLPQAKSINRIFQAIIFLACGLLISYGFYQYHIGFQTMREFLAKNPEYMIQSREFIRRMQSNVVFATFIYAPAFGSYLTMMFLTILGFCFAQGNLFQPAFKLRLCLKYVLLLLIIPLLILTKAKAAWLGLGIGLICFFLLIKPKTRQKGFLIGTLLSLLGLFTLSFILISSSDKIHLPKLENFLVSFKVRLEYWKAAFAMIKQRPLLGFGPGTFGSVYPLFKTLNAEETIMCHNSFLQIWAEGGSFVFLAFCLFWLSFIQQAISRIKKIFGASRFISAGLFSAILSFLFVNLLDFSLYDGQTALIGFGLIGLLQYQLNSEPKLNTEHMPKRKLHKLLIICIGCLFLTCVLGYSGLVYCARIFDDKASFEYKNARLEQALAYTNKAIGLQGFSGKYYYHKGIILEKMILNPKISPEQKKELLNQAVKNFEQAVKLDWFMPHYHYKLATVLYYLNQPEAKQRAGREFEQAAALYPVNPFYHEQLAEFYNINGKIGDAQKQQAIAAEMKKYFKTGTR